MNRGELTWRDIVVDALRELGGQAHLSQINDRVKNHPKIQTNPTWRDTIRRVVRQYSVFEPVPPERSGVYKLIEKAPAEPKSQELDSPDSTVNHDVAQGMLAALGSIYGYETFVPSHDQTQRVFQGKRLGNIVTLRDCTDVFRGPNLAKVREIDVLWFNEDDYGLYPVYAFEVEHTTKVKEGLDRLLKIPQRFPVGLFVLGPGETEKNLFDRLVQQTPFRAHKDRFTFRSYRQLQQLYNSAVSHSSARTEFGLLGRYPNL